MSRDYHFQVSLDSLKRVLGDKKTPIRNTVYESYLKPVLRSVRVNDWVQILDRPRAEVMIEAGLIEDTGVYSMYMATDEAKGLIKRLRREERAECGRRLKLFDYIVIDNRIIDGLVTYNLFDRDALLTYDSVYGADALRWLEYFGLVYEVAAELRPTEKLTEVLQELCWDDLKEHRLGLSAAKKIANRTYRRVYYWSGIVAVERGGVHRWWNTMAIRLAYQRLHDEKGYGDGFVAKMNEDWWEGL